MPKLANREYRSMTLSSEPTLKRFESDYYVEGYAARYEPYVLYEDDKGPIKEEFCRGCFDECDMSDIIFQYNHEGSVLARLRNQTLVVDVDDEGLFVAADLSKSEEARRRYEEISNGLVDRMSWGFIPGEYEFDRATRTIRHTRVKKIFDVSCVSIPANDTTSIQARSAFIDGVIEDAALEERNRELETMKLKIKLKLGGIS